MVKFIIERKNEAHYNQYIQTSLKKLNMVQTCDVYPENNDTLVASWNKGIQAFIDSKISDDDIVCFVHEDVTIADPNFIQKLEMSFKLKPEIGVFGVAGTPNINESCMWFEDVDNIKGQWVQTHNNSTILMGKGKVGFFDEIVAVHKFFMAVRPEILKEGLRFDECFSYDLYNIDFCFQVLERGYKIGVIDILTHHVSSREGNNGIEHLKDKYKEMGYKFPITLDQFKNLDQIQGVEITL
jgi:hypothetical protein